jgi:hypothetical protein
MTEFSDLSSYSYTRSAPAEKNVGWLGPSTEFRRMVADDAFLDSLWRYCKTSIAQTRGMHLCELCSSHHSCIAERAGEKLSLGSAEIRVFSNAGDVYAAPNLIYHYVQVHQYRPPDEFIDAVRTGPSPQSKEYFERLSVLGWSWERTEAPGANSGKRFRAVKTPAGTKIVEE